MAAERASAAQAALVRDLPRLRRGDLRLLVGAGGDVDAARAAKLAGPPPWRTRQTPRWSSPPPTRPRGSGASPGARHRHGLRPLGQGPGGDGCGDARRATPPAAPAGPRAARGGGVVTAVPSAGPAGYSLVLPRGWVDVPLDGRRRTALARLLRLAGPLPAALRQDLRRRLELFTAEAARGRAETLHLCVRVADGFSAPGVPHDQPVRPAARRPGRRRRRAVRRRRRLRCAPPRAAVGSDAGPPSTRPPGRGGDVLRVATAGDTVTYYCAGPRDTLLLLVFGVPLPSWPRPSTGCSTRSSRPCAGRRRRTLRVRGHRFLHARRARRAPRVPAPPPEGPAHDDPPDGRPQVSPVACGVDAEGRVVVSTYPERAKARNAERDARVSLCVLSDDWDGPWVQVDGRAEVLHAAGRRGAAGGLLPLARRGASGLGRVPRGDGPPGQVTAAGRSSAGDRSRPVASPPGWPARVTSLPEPTVHVAVTESTSRPVRTLRRQEATMADRRPTQLELLHELEPVVEANLNRHLGRQGVVPARVRAVERGPRLRRRRSAARPGRRSSPSIVRGRAHRADRQPADRGQPAQLPPRDRGACSAATAPGAPGCTAGPPRRAGTASRSATTCWPPAPSTRSRWSGPA